MRILQIGTTELHAEPDAMTKRKSAMLKKAKTTTKGCRFGVETWKASIWAYHEESTG
jgi:hypothetical protein